jgi:hypothetical protein
MPIIFGMTVARPGGGGYNPGVMNGNANGNGNGHAGGNGHLPGPAGTPGNAPGNGSAASGGPGTPGNASAGGNVPQNASDASAVPPLFSDVPKCPPGMKPPKANPAGGRFRTGRKPGRPRKPIDENVVLNMAAAGCTYPEIARACGVDPETIARRFADEIAKKRAEYAWTIRDRQNREAVMEGNPTMLIWLGKNVLGQKDRAELTGPNGGAAINVNILNVNYEEFARTFAQLANASAPGDEPGGNRGGDVVADGY